MDGKIIAAVIVIIFIGVAALSVELIYENHINCQIVYSGESSNPERGVWEVDARLEVDDINENKMYILKFDGYKGDKLVNSTAYSLVGEVDENTYTLYFDEEVDKIEITLSDDENKEIETQELLTFTQGHAIEV